MANVTKNVKHVKKMVETEVEETTYTMELSLDELKTLRAVFNRIGGDPNSGPRKHVDSMSNAIDGGVGHSRYDWSWAEPEISLMSKRRDGIYFNDYGSEAE